MSLYPGRARPVTGGFVIDDTALANSMAKAMEEELDDLHTKLKGAALPDQGREDRRMLFVAIARGVLRYLHEHQVAVETSTEDGDGNHAHDVDFNVTMDSHTAH